LLEHAEVTEIAVVGDRTFRVGQFGDVPVVLAITGIGMVNAEQTTRTLLDRFEVVGIVVSGVAGTTRRIGDVDVPVAWALKDGDGEWATDPRWTQLARQLEQPGVLALERCTTVPTDGAEKRVCVPHEPALAVRGVGLSGDSFGGKAYPCDPNGDEVSGCDGVLDGPARRPPYDPRTMQSIESVWDATVDMETAAIAREAAARGLPYIAFRAGSDGGGDPLGLPGFPAQFFAYYRLAARNAAIATLAFLERLGKDTAWRGD
jgi:nucleoside phosphorylase